MIVGGDAAPIAHCFSTHRLALALATQRMPPGRLFGTARCNTSRRTTPLIPTPFGRLLPTFRERGPRGRRPQISVLRASLHRRAYSGAGSASSILGRGRRLRAEFMFRTNNSCTHDAPSAWVQAGPSRAATCTGDNRRSRSQTQSDPCSDSPGTSGGPRAGSVGALSGYVAVAQVVLS